MEYLSLHRNEPVLQPLFRARRTQPQGFANYSRTGSVAPGAAIGSFDWPAPPSSRPVEDEGAAKISTCIHEMHLEGDQSVDVLILRNNGIRDDGASKLASMLYENQMLRLLDLRDNRISDEGCAALAYALEANSSLHTLLLSGNHINNTGFLILKKSLSRNKGLRILDLGMNRIDSAPLLAIRDELRRRKGDATSAAAIAAYARVVKAVKRD